MLIECPECAAMVSSEAEECIKCGYPSLNPKKSIERLEREIKQSNWEAEQEDAANKNNCPVCHSNHTQKLSIIYRNGVTNTSTTTESSAWGFGANNSAGLASITSTATGQSLTALARRAAPPYLFNTKKAIIIGIGFFALAFFFAFIGIYFLAMISMLSAMGSGLYAIVAYLSNRFKGHEEYRLWDKKYMCLKCEHKFIPR